MKVSIIIPVYNGEQFLGEAINSVLSQSFKQWELIIVDDGSADGTYELAKSFNDERVKTFRIENGGVSNARNIGYEKSSGEFLAFLDADDVWNEDNLALKVDALEGDDVGLVHSNCLVVDEKGQSLNQIKKGKAGNILDDLLLWNGTCIPAPSSILVKREAIQKVGGFNTSLSTAADQEFFFRVAANYQIGLIDKVTWKYRVHGNNMHQNIRRMECDHIRAYRLADQNKLFKSWIFKQKCFSNLYLILAGSWWVNQNRHPRTFLFLAKSALTYPPNLKHILKKLR